MRGIVPKAIAAGAAIQRELGPCGLHPKACWITGDSGTEAREVPDNVDPFTSYCTACEEVRLLKESLLALCDKLDLVDKATLGTFTMAQIHGMPYSGPNWSDEYKAARALLAEPAGKVDANAD
jgi:hypothetical protein